MAYGKEWFATLCLVASSIIAVVANLLLVIVFFKRRGLRTISNRFVINLLLTNLLSSVLIIPLLILEQGSPGFNQDDFRNTSIIENVTLLEGASSNGYILREEEIYDREVTVMRSGEVEKEKELVKTDNIVIGSTISGEIDLITRSESVLDKIPAYNRTFVNSNQRLNGVLCIFAEACTSLVCTASIFSILLIGVDQYFAVLHSLRYHSYIDKYRSLVLILASWAIAFVFASLAAITHSSSNSVWSFCHQKIPKNPSSRNTLASLYVFIYFTVVIFIPFVAICGIYVCIYTAAHKNSERMRKSTSSQGSSSNNFDKCGDATPTTESVKLATGKPIKKVQSAPTFVTFRELESEFISKPEKPPDETVKFEIKSPSDSSDELDDSEKEMTYVMIPKDCDTPKPERKVSRTYSERVATTLFNSIKYKISNASIFRYREESRAAKISILVIFMVLVCYLPYGIALILNSAVVPLDIPSQFNYTSLILLASSSVISPFLFAYRNKRIQRELCKVFGLLPPKSPTSVPNSPRRSSIASKRPNVLDDIYEKASEPFLANDIPSVIINVTPEKKSILKRVCSKNWPTYKNCNFITVPDSCLNADARGSFSSASTQISTED